MLTADLSENDTLEDTHTDTRSSHADIRTTNTAALGDGLTVESLTPDGEPTARVHGKPFSFVGRHGPILVTVDASLTAATDRISNASKRPITHSIQSLVDSIVPAIGEQYRSTEVRLIASSLIAPDFHTGRIQRTLPIKVISGNEPELTPSAAVSSTPGSRYTTPVGVPIEPLIDALSSPQSGLRQDDQGALMLKIAHLEHLIETEHHDHAHCQTPSIDASVLATAIAEALAREKKPALFNFGGLNVLSLEVGEGHHGETWREMIPAILKEGGRSILKTMLSLAILSAVGSGVMVGLHAYDSKYPAPAGVSEWAKKNIALEAGMSTREGLGFKFVAKEGKEEHAGVEKPHDEPTTSPAAKESSAHNPHHTTSSSPQHVAGFSSVTDTALSHYSKTAQAIITTEGGMGRDVRLLQLWLVNANYVNGESVLSEGHPIYSRKLIDEVQDYVAHSAGVNRLETAHTNPNYMEP